MDEDLGLDASPDLDDEADGLLLGDLQEGPGLFDEPLPDPEPACDIKAASGEVDESASPPEPAAPAAPRPADPALLTRPAPPLALVPLRNSKDWASYSSITSALLRAVPSEEAIFMVTDT